MVDSDLIDLVRGVPSLRELSDHDLGRVAALLGERSVASGEVVVEEGTVGDQSFLVVEGEASVTAGGVPIARVGSGEFIGELGLLTDEPRCATVRAETPMQLLVLDKATLTSLIDPITEALLGTMARRLQRETVESTEKQTEAVTDGVNDPWPVGAEVMVRSRYSGDWVGGFEIDDVDRGAGTPRILVRRYSDGAVLPVFFAAADVRFV